MKPFVLRVAGCAFSGFRSQDRDMFVGCCTGVSVTNGSRKKDLEGGSRRVAKMARMLGYINARKVRVVVHVHLSEIGV